MAPDLFDVRSATYEAEAEPSEAEDELLAMRAAEGLEAMRSSPARRAPLDAERLRALEASPEAPPPSALADEWLRKYADALQWLNEGVLPLCEQLGEPLLKARTMASIATAQGQLGQLDAAIRTLRDDVLPVFQQSGSMLELASDQARLALYLRNRNGPGDRAEADRLAHVALQNLEGMDFSVAAQLRKAIQKALQPQGREGS